jgi:hypothetical protein
VFLGSEYTVVVLASGELRLLGDAASAYPEALRLVFWFLYLAGFYFLSLSRARARVSERERESVS